MASTQPLLVYDRIDANRRRSWLLLVLFAAALLPIAAYVAMYLMIWIAPLAFGVGGLLFGEHWGAGLILDIVIAVGIVLTVGYLEYRYASALVLRIAGARPVGPGQETDLLRTVENLCIGAGLRHPKVYVIESAAPNGLATGLDPDHASLVVTRGLLALLDRRELEGVIAHALSRIGNHDTRLGTLTAAGVASLRLPFLIVVAFFRFLFRLHWIVGVGALLYIGLPLLAGIPFGVGLSIELLRSDPAVGFLLLFSTFLAFYVLFGAPLFGELIRRAMLRQREFLADADAALLTRYPEGLARALAKMDAASGLPLKPGRATSHLYTVDPLPPDAPWWDRIFSSHTPIEERIAVLAATGDGIPPSVLKASAEAGAEFARAHASTIVPGPVRQEAAPSADEAAATADISQTHAAFCLTGTGAALYERPNIVSKQLPKLPADSLITVLGTEGDFLRVITPQDRIGYVARSASMMLAEMPTDASSSAEGSLTEPSMRETDLPTALDTRESEGKERQPDYARVGIVLLVLVAVLILLVWAADRIPCVDPLGGC